MLYSVIVKFNAKEQVQFKYFPGESLHGMLFSMLSEQDEAKANELHNEYETKPFTISPILPYPRRKNNKWVLKKDKEYFFRITFLEDEWYLLFVDYFLDNAELNLQGVDINIREVLTHSNQDKRCNSITCQTLENQARQKKKISFKFHSTTTFRIDKKHIIFPKANLVFNSLKTKWEEYNPDSLTLTAEDLDQIYISRYNLSSTMEKFNGYPIKGFKGKCVYELSSDLSARKMREINLLADYAFYSGIGYKTTMGLGQVARTDKK
ncbi:MAG: CRISPR-associated endoribonuclease Cas6 [Bacillota bacterium]